MSSDDILGRMHMRKEPFEHMQTPHREHFRRLYNVRLPSRYKNNCYDCIENILPGRIHKVARVRICLKIVIIYTQVRLNLCRWSILVLRHRRCYRAVF